MKYLPLNLDLWPVSRAKSKRAVSAPEVKQPQAGQQKPRRIEKSSFCYAAYFVVKAPQVSLAVVDSNF